jgi:hypothetical protein
MAIQDRNLTPGTQLVATYKKQEHRAQVVANEDGKPRYQLADGREFKSPSAAGTAITGKACNGWAFWSVDASQAAPALAPAAPEAPNALLAPEPAPAAADAPQAEAGGSPAPETPVAETPEPTHGFRRVPNQRGVAEGKVRLYCDACRASFTAPAGQQPETCPQGHWAGEPPPEEPTA